MSRKYRSIAERNLARRAARPLLLVALAVLVVPGVQVTADGESVDASYDDPALAFLAKEFPEHLRWLQTHAPGRIDAHLAGGPVLDAYAEPDFPIPTFDLPNGTFAVASPAIDAAATRASSGTGRDPLPPPRRDFRDAMTVCDDTGASSLYIVSLDLQPAYYPRLDPMYYNPWGLTRVVGLNGTTGDTEWAYENGEYLNIMVPPFAERTPPRIPYWYWAPQRFGDPLPTYPSAPMEQARVIPDITGDGICDVAAFGVTHTWPFGETASSILGLTLVEFTGSLRVHDSVTGEIAWENPIDSTWLDVRTPPIVAPTAYEVYEYQDWPTGWETYDSPNGPRIAWKTTDVNFTFVGADREYRVQESFHILDATTGQTLKTTVIDRPPSSTQITTWLTGVAELGGDAELELVYDQAGPACCAADLTTPAIAVLEGALDSTGHVWGPSGFYTARQTGTGGNIPGEQEEITEVYAFHHAKIVGDMSGDGLPEVVGTYLTVPPPGKFPVNEDFKTHIIPLDGASGIRHWGADDLVGSTTADGQDVKVQGWGYVQGLTDRGGAVVALAAGTADVITPKLPGTRFPLKEVRIQVLDAEDAKTRFAWRAPFATDSYLAYDLAIQAARDTMVIGDRSGDGVTDIVTPAIHVPADSATQRLLADARHEYLILDGMSGKTHTSFEAWGGIGLVLPCQDDSGAITIATGHARRIDLLRFDGATGQQLMRRPMYNNPAPQSMTAGTELVFLTGSCGVTAEGHVLTGIDIGANSLKRGFETIPPIGAVLADGREGWLAPELVGEAPMDASLDFFAFDEANVPNATALTATATLATIGLALGIGTRRLRDWRRR